MKADFVRSYTIQYTASVASTYRSTIATDQKNRAGSLRSGRQRINYVSLNPELQKNCQQNEKSPWFSPQASPTIQLSPNFLRSRKSKLIEPTQVVDANTNALFFHHCYKSLSSFHECCCYLRPIPETLVVVRRWVCHPTIYPNSPPREILGIMKYSTPIKPRAPTRKFIPCLSSVTRAPPPRKVVSKTLSREVRCSWCFEIRSDGVAILILKVVNASCQ